MSIIRLFTVLAFASWTLYLNGCSGISPVAPVSMSSSNTSEIASLPKGIVDVHLTVLHRYYCPATGDHMTKPVYYQPGYGYNYEGPFAYVPSYSWASGVTNVLNEMYNGGNGDHMTSIDPNEGSSFGYIWEQYLGRIFTTNVSGSGLWPFNRYYKIFTLNGIQRIDHMDDNGEITPMPSGYTLGSTFGYAWGTTGPRYSDPVGCHASDNNNRQLMSAQGITIGAAPCWGGCIVSLKKSSMKNVELVNICPAGGVGREIQSCLWYSTADNPTEGGDTYWNGSPIINFKIDKTSSTQPCLSTTAIALQWGNYGNPPTYYTTRDEPVLSGTTFSKAVTIEDATWIKYDETVGFAKDNPLTHITPVVLYLNNQFDQFWLYWWNGSSLVTNWHNPDIRDPNNDKLDIENIRDPSRSELLVANNKAGTIAVGLFYPPHTAAQYQTYSTWNASTYYLSGSGSGPYENGTAVISMNQFYIPVKAGTSMTYHPSILVGTLKEVKDKAAVLAKINFGY